MTDVIGNDPIGGAGSPDSHHNIQYGGEIYYVNDATGDDLNGGKFPDYPLKTIGAANLKVIDGDAINIMAGTYTETGLDITNNAIQIKCETGVKISPATGTGLTISGNDCALSGLSGPLQITAAADQIGINATGDGYHLRDVIVLTAAGITGIKCAGDLGDLINCKVAGTKAGGKSFEITGGKVTLRWCGTAGNAASYGFHVNNNSDYGLMDQCFSTGNTAAGFYLASGTARWTIKLCSSGKGDGKNIDIDRANVWSNFTFDNVVDKEITFTTTGLQKYNLFKVTGCVQINKIYADVETVISSNMTAVYLETWDGTAADTITRNDGVISGLPANSLIAKTDKFDRTIEIASSAAGNSMDEVDAKKESFRVVQKTGDVDTYIRMSATSTDAPPSGVVHWYCDWSPLTGNGFLEPVS